MKKIFTLIAAMLLVPWVGWGQEKSGFTIETGQGKYDAGRKELTITQNATISNSEATEDVLIIDGGNEKVPLEITLNGININRTNKSPNVPAIKIASGSYVKFILQNENSIATNTEQGTDATTGVITLEDKDNPSSLTITGQGTLNITANSGINAIAGQGSVINIEDGTIKANSGIGGLESTVTVSGGNITIDDEKGCTACIGNGKSVSISGESTNITLKNPSVGIDADDIDIVESEINITYGADYTKIGTGITYSNSLEMSDCKYVITEKRSEVKATGISANAGTAEISNCKMDMLVRDGISIKGSTLSIEKTEININALQYPIVATSTEVSANSYLSLKSTKKQGGYPGIRGTLKVDGSSYIIADSDSDSSTKTETSCGIEDKKRGNWTGIVLESTNIDDFVSGYAYGNVTLGSDFELNENDQLIYCEPTNLEFGQYNIINNGSVCIANEYEDKGIEEQINKGNGTGTYYYEIFFEDDGLEIPYSLQNKMDRYGHTIGDILISMDDKSKATTDLVHRKVHPQNSNQENGNMVFGCKQKDITLAINKDWICLNDGKPKYDGGYTVKSFDVKTKKDGKVIATGVTSFEMPAEAVVIYNLKIEGYKLSYELAGDLVGKTVDVIFKDQKQKNVIESAAEDDLIWIFIMAPGYESFDITDIKAESSAYIGSGDQPAFQSSYSNDKCKVYVFPSMPKGDVTFVITGDASNPIPFKVSIDENIQNGEVTASKEDGTDATAETTTIYYKDKIVVNATPKEGYELNSLQYKIDDEETVVDIKDYDQESGTYSFLMPAADVTITAVFSEIKYTVSIGEIENGSVTILKGDEEIEDKAQFVPGSDVVLNLKPEEGFIPGELSYTYMDGGEEKTVYISGVSFQMPPYDVTIHATFVLDPTIDDDEEGSGIAQKRYRLYLADQDFYLNDEYDEAGLVLYSRHDKKYTDVGGSFTVWFEKNGEVNEGARVFISNRANGEYKEVKLDEVSGYYQIRNVQSNIYVKLYTEEEFPVANESIEATDARAYAQANKIVVITPEPTDVQIISMAGAVVATAQVAGQQEFANLTEGVYIVRMGDSIVKLQVRN